MAFADVETNINTRVAAAVVAAGLAATKLLRDNDPEPRTDLGPFVRLRISTSGQEMIAMGGASTRKWRTSGEWRAELNVPAKKGTSGDSAPMRELFAALQTQFRGVSVASPSVRYMPPSPGEIQEVGAWSRRIVTGRFTYDEVG